MLRRAFLLALGLSAAQFACDGVQFRRAQSPNTNMTPEEREKARAYQLRLMTEIYRPTLAAAQRDVLESLEVTLGTRPLPGIAAASAGSRINASKGKGAVKITPVSGGLVYTLDHPPGVAEELAAQVEAASKANRKAQELARERHFGIVLGVIGWRSQFGELEDVDKERIRAELDMLREVDVVAAVALAQLAAYQGALAKHDGRSLDTVAAKAKSALPPKVNGATTADVDELVKVLPGALRKVRDEYIEVARGYASPEAFPPIEQGTRKMFDPYIAMAERDAHGTNVVLDRSRSEAPASPPPGTPADPEAMKTAARAYASALLDTGSVLFPALGVVLKGIQGATALAKGDYKAAIDCAVAMIPAGGMAKDVITAGAEIVKAKI